MRRANRPSALRLIVCLFGMLGPVGADASPALLCDRAARTAATESGVPPAVMRAIARTETGRQRDGRLQPWPWTVNMEGTGRWFASRRAARAFAMRHFDRGARSFDIGCFQINYKWHGRAFASIDAMFDPLENARYAAAFLKRLHAETGSWPDAAGAYHSRTPALARRYRTRFERIRRRLAGRPPAAVPPPGAGRQPLFSPQGARPLVGSAGRPALLGSLVPQTAAARQRLIVLDRPQGGPS